jgi:hypothetical protein
MGDYKCGFGSVSQFTGYSLAVTMNNYYTVTDFHFQSTDAHALGFSVSTSLLVADLNTEISASN